MKVKHVLMIAAVLLAMLVMPVAAEDNVAGDKTAILESIEAPKYTITIPDKIGFDEGFNLVATDVKIGNGASLVVNISSGNGWKLSLTDSPNDMLKYQMLIDGVVNTEDKPTVLAVALPADSGSKMLTFEKLEKAKKAGIYTDSLTFEIDVIDGGAANVKEFSVSTAAALQTALDNAVDGTIIKLGADITGDVTVTQKEGVKITINGDGKKYNGFIFVNGKSAGYETAALTIKNVNFEATSLDNDAFISLGSSTNTNNVRYTNHVTVEDCTFTNNGNGEIVAIKSYTGGDKNLIIDGCTVNAGMHSLAQLTNVEVGLKIIDCNVYSVRGINLNAGESLEMSGCTFEVEKYAVRFGAGSSANTEEKFFSITNSDLYSTCTDDTVIVFRGNSVYSTLTLTGTTLTADEGKAIFSGSTDKTTIIIDGITQ